MDLIKTYSWRIAPLALLVVLQSCAPVRSEAVRKTFVPPSESPGRIVTPAPPAIQPNAEVGEAPHFITSMHGTAPNSRIDAVLREADFHFQEGRRLYGQGDEEGSRKEFDRAIDALLTAPDGSSVRGPVDRKLDDLVDAIHRLDLAGLGAAETVDQIPFEKPPLEDVLELTFPVDPKLKDKVAEELRATASQLPLEMNETVLSYVNYFSSERGRKVLVNGLRRAGRYRPLIQRIFDEEGVPQELIFLAQAESGFLPRAVSRKSAVGMWQFIAASGRLYGLTQTAYRDDRLDPEKSTRAAARHLRDLYHRYGDWYLAMAAYNCGPGVIDRAVERTGYADFWELRRRRTMPLESTNYVPAILAMTIMVKNAREYGIDGLETDAPLQYDNFEVAAPTHLALVADLTDSSVPQLRDMNPSLLSNLAPEGSSLKVPKGTGGALAAGVEAIPEGSRAAWRAHRVAGGETMASIARFYRVKEDAISAANHSGTFAPGDLLIIPAAPERVKVAARRTTSRKSGSRHTAVTASSRQGGTYKQASVARKTRHVTVKQ